MAVSVHRFRKAFPEFDRSEDELCAQKIAEATARISATTWGTRADLGIMYLAAHLLSRSPEGEQARLKAENRVDTYMIEWQRMKLEVTAGVGRVI
jgi:hypothetical protein